MRVTVGSAVGCNGAVTGVDDMSAIFRNRVLGRHKDESKIKKESFGSAETQVGLHVLSGNASVHRVDQGHSMHCIWVQRWDRILLSPQKPVMTIRLRG